ncbi:MAG: 1-deoxy-D-xylulose-5-phosphate reductoisomerase [Candidatus Obscuribacterales bacterium]|nr:1-deoxy-D-xylulose-5-phosphate reductoisomerase [Steroidobacteraceae bacterium]
MSTTDKRIGVAILGSTGSIGCSTLEVLALHADRFRVVALTAQINANKLLEQCRIHRPDFAVLVDPIAARQLEAALRALTLPTQVLSGEHALVDIAAHESVDYVMAAIVGAAGLRPALAAAEHGKRVLLANKEALVMSGPVFMDAVRRGNAELIPIDSEHNAIFQCLPNAASMGRRAPGVRKIILTASGGPFLRMPVNGLASVTPEQACAHPRWSMGRKISVDSATLMNKGLELIEACLLFDVPPAQVEVLIHPQSIVHSMVEYLDGSVIAQLGNPDMRTPIAHALGCPDRLLSGVESLDLVRIGRLDFEPPDLERFSSLKLARAVAEAAGSAPAVLNASNEVAVAAFLAGRIAFNEITHLSQRVLDMHTVGRLQSLEDVLAVDAWARKQAEAMLAAIAA